MKILAFDTSSTSGSIALLDGGRLVAEWTVGDVGTHADWLMKAIDTLLQSASCRINEIDLFAAGAGPGSFTGLRVGISTVKGLAWTLKKNVAGVSTLESLAFNIRHSNALVCPVLDARKGELYTALYSFNGGNTETILKESALTPQNLFEIISVEGKGRATVFLGAGLNAYSGLIKNNVKGAVFAPEPLWHLRASNIALIALYKHSMGIFASPEKLSPVYLRKSEVEFGGARTLRTS